MEFVAGRNLEQAARQNRPSLPEVARIVAALSRAVAHAHAAGVVHLDIKPENVLLGDDGVPRLIDFGLGRLRPAWDERPNDTLDLSGTLAYMSPERATGVKGQSMETADVFGLGGVLYFLLTGQRLYTGSTFKEVWTKVRAGQWDQKLLDRPDIPKSLRQICRRCLATNPAERYRSAHDLAADLERFVRWPVLFRRAAIAVMALVPLVVFGLILGFRPTVPERTIEQPDAKLRLRVWNGEKFQDLVRCLPLEVGDQLTVEADRPAGFHATLFWVGSDGKARELLSASPAQEETTMTYPKLGQVAPLEGLPGTELILMCSRKFRPIDVTKVAETLARVQEWPALPGLSLLRLDRAGVTIENTARGIGRAMRGPRGGSGQSLATASRGTSPRM